MRAHIAGPIMTTALRVVFGGFLLVMPAVTTLAQERGEERGHHEFREHDVRRFGHAELGFWQGGGWRHEMFNGRMGWWWVSGGVRYFYESPVYPYPMVVSGMAFAEPVIVVPGAPLVIQQAAPPPQVWYYCDSPAGYYPYVATCSLPFRPVAARPQ